MNMYFNFLPLLLPFRGGMGEGEASHPLSLFFDVYRENFQQSWVFKLDAYIFTTAAHPRLNLIRFILFIFNSTIQKFSCLFKNIFI